MSESDNSATQETNGVVLGRVELPMCRSQRGTGHQSRSKKGTIKNYIEFEVLSLFLYLLIHRLSSLLPSPFLLSWPGTPRVTNKRFLNTVRRTYGSETRDGPHTFYVFRTRPSLVSDAPPTVHLSLGVISHYRWRVPTLTKRQRKTLTD